MVEYGIGFAIGFGFASAVGYLFFLPSAFARSLGSGEQG